MSDTILDKKFECFDLEIENKIAKLTLNRPEKLNSMIRSFGMNYLKLSLLLIKKHLLGLLLFLRLENIFQQVWIFLSSHKIM